MHSVNQIVIDSSICELVLCIGCHHSLCHQPGVDSDPILCCSSCGIRVHRFCYGVCEIRVPWLCYACEAGSKSPFCALCKKVEDGVAVDE